MASRRGLVFRSLALPLAVGLVLSSGITLRGQSPAKLSSAVGSTLPSFVLRPAPFIQMPGVKEYRYLHAIDSNSPLHWDGDALYLFNSFLHPYRTSGPDLLHQTGQVRVHLGDFDDLLDMWIEATFKDADGTCTAPSTTNRTGFAFRIRTFPPRPRSAG